MLFTTASISRFDTARTPSGATATTTRSVSDVRTTIGAACQTSTMTRGRFLNAAIRSRNRDRSDSLGMAVLLVRLEILRARRKGNGDPMSPAVVDQIDRAGGSFVAV